MGWGEEGLQGVRVAQGVRVPHSHLASTPGDWPIPGAHGNHHNSPRSWHVGQDGSPVRTAASVLLQRTSPRTSAYNVGSPAQRSNPPRRRPLPARFGGGWRGFPSSLARRGRPLSPHNPHRPIPLVKPQFSPNHHSQDYPSPPLAILTTFPTEYPPRTSPITTYHLRV